MYLYMDRILGIMEVECKFLNNANYLFCENNTFQGIINCLLAQTIKTSILRCDKHI